MRASPTPPLLRALRRRSVPIWWRDAKLGIFIHWVPASIPAFAPTDVDSADILSIEHPNPLSRVPYTEWYESSLQFPDSPVAAFHREHYGDRPYTSFADDFRVTVDERWDPDDWADRLARSGARYVVLVAKHMDGFCLWPTQVVNPNRPGWHTERDVVGELAEAVRARGMRFGVYYCGGLDSTFDGRRIGTPADLYAAIPHSDAYADYAEAQVRELIERYRPSVLWNDIGWPFGGDRLWRLLTDYLDAVPDGVVNDRFQPRRWYFDLLELGPTRAGFDALARKSLQARRSPPPPPFAHHRTPEYMTFADQPPTVAWEVCRGIDRSFGYNRASKPEHFLARDDLLGSFADIVARGGNLLLNVGPRGDDAAIPDEQQLRLDWLGEWLASAGPTVVGSRPWVRSEAATADGHELRFTASGDDVHVVVVSGARDRLLVPGLRPGVGGDVVLGDGTPLPWTESGDDDTEVDLSSVPPDHPWPLVLTVRHAVAGPAPVPDRP